MLLVSMVLSLVAASLSPERLESFNGWLEVVSSNSAKIEVRSTEYGLGVIAKKTVKKYEMLLEIPANVTVSREGLKRRPYYSLLQSHSDEVLLTQEVSGGRR